MSEINTYYLLDFFCYIFFYKYLLLKKGKGNLRISTMKKGKHTVLQPKAPAVAFIVLTVTSVITVKAFSVMQTFS